MSLIALAALHAAVLSTPHLATAAPATTTSPTTDASDATPKIELEGVLVPIDAQEVKPKLRQYTSSTVVAQVVPHGSTVKAGQTLIAFDLTDLDQEILEATSDLEVAKANLAKAESDATTGDQADAATLEEKTDALADAELNLKWWRDIDGPDFLKRLDQMVQSSKDGIDDQEDELDQLRKMYKSEELTNATADIVVKRAVRNLERSKESFEITQHMADKQKATEYPNQQQTAERAVESAKRGLVDAKASAAQSSVTRAAAVLKARGALRDAQKKLSELEQDKQALSDIKSKVDGVVYYGSFDDGAWQGAKDDALRSGEKTETSHALMTVFTPGKLRVKVKVTEPNFFKVREGGRAAIHVAALPDATITGTFDKRAALPSADGSFDQIVELSGSADARLVPGMKAKVEVEEGQP